MHRTSMTIALSAMLLLVIALIALPTTTQGAITVSGGGGTFIAPLMNYLTDAYQFAETDATIVYEDVGEDQAIQIWLGGSFEYVATVQSLDKATQEGYNVILLPVMAQALVPIYNLPELAAANKTLVLDGLTLSGIWSGSILWWNDTAIQNLNPTATMPQALIQLAYPNDTTAGITSAGISSAFGDALSVFSSDFAALWLAANSSFANVDGITDHVVNTGTPGALQPIYVKATPYSLSYTTLPIANANGATSSRMKNKAGSVVGPTAAAVLSAVNEVTDELTSSFLSPKIVNGNLSTSWPLCLTNYIAIYQSTNSSDCSYVENLLAFFAWSQLNPHTFSKVQDLGYTPLPFGFKTKMIDLMGTVVCNGERAFGLTWLIGEGLAFNLYNTWMDAYESANILLRYFQNPTATAIADLAGYNVDFGAISTPLTAAQQLAMPDVVQLPVMAYPAVVAYNVPELVGKGTLVFDLATVADVMLGTVDNWNHSAIRDLNPTLAHLLPNKPIMVVTPLGAPTVMQLLSEALSGASAQFNQLVGVGTNLRMPVDAFGRNINTSDPTTVINSNTYSLGIWLNEQIRQQRRLGVADLINTAGNRVSPTYESLLSAINDFSDNATITNFVLGSGSGSWPIATYHQFIIHQSTMSDCTKARGLIDWVYWSQTSAAAVELAQKSFLGIAGQSAPMRKRMLEVVRGMTCDGQHVSSVYACIVDGTICSDHGVCTASQTCICESGYEGDLCETAISASNSDVPLGIILGVSIPVGLALVLLVVCLVVGVAMYARMSGDKEDDWEVDMGELEMGEQLGAGGYGEVHKAVWKGTEVAVKMMISESGSRELERNFKEEVRVMTALRHPNVVLFMAACTKAPKMCIIMEYMALGSMFDLLHNELIPDIPFALRNKMAYQAAKGMHFLHSSGIVHRDLKSLNLLLDSKWNVKVSDFGLTKFKEEMKRDGGNKEIQGSVHWTAPEILNEVLEVDFMLTDVYSFGIILWELVTRQQPYMGLSPAAVAVAVIRDNARPALPEGDEATCPAEFLDLICTCWHHDPTIRPSFLEVMTRLSALGGEGGTSSLTRTSTSSSSGPATGAERFSSWTLPTTTSASHPSTGSSSSSGSAASGAAAAAGGGAGGVRAPEGEMAIVFTDITRAASLWEFNAEAMRDATLTHNDLLRSLLRKHRGYEVVFLRDRNSGEGSFCLAFQNVLDAVEWCMEAQHALANSVQWPEALLDHPGAAEEWGDADERIVFKGLRVRMGVHCGQPRMVRDPMTRRVEYIGPVVNAAARITAMTHGGQILMSAAAYGKIRESEVAKESKRVTCLGKFEMPDAPRGAKLYELKSRGLEGRFFGGVERAGGKDSDEQSPSSGHSGGSEPQEKTPRDGRHNRRDGSGVSGSRSGESDDEVMAVVGEGMRFQEDNFLTSANLCRWIIDFNEIALGKQVGLGSYGVVFRGKWKGVEVAVKRFIKQKLDERRMLEFRAEMAFLAELHHPNIVLFIGACVKRPNLCIVTEFVKNGSLRDILSDSRVKLSWHQRVKMLHSAALGITYLHSLHPVIVHRDLKPSNMLVDENMNVKVADFGFARIKEENATMTRCGTPCWTAPEVIRGEKYSEKADVFSFGIIMWEVLTRKEPFAGRNFMGVSLDVLEGRRPAIPTDCTISFKKLMKKCWHGEAKKRPAMEDVVAQLDIMLGGGGGDAERGGGGV